MICIAFPAERMPPSWNCWRSAFYGYMKHKRTVPPRDLLVELLQPAHTPAFVAGH